MASRYHPSAGDPPEVWLLEARAKVARSRDLLQEMAELVERSQERLAVSVELLRIADRQIELGWVPKT